jgi:hypothetical protein
VPPWQQKKAAGCIFAGQGPGFALQGLWVLGFAVNHAMITGFYAYFNRTGEVQRLGGNGFASAAV